MNVHDRPPEQLRTLTEQLGRLKHDLGKYICFRQRWLPDDADAEARREALVADLLQTRSGPAGTVDARAVWGEFEAWFTEASLHTTPEGAELVAALDRLWPVLEALRGDSAVDLPAAASDCRVVSDRIRALHARARDAARTQGAR